MFGARARLKLSPSFQQENDFPRALFDITQKSIGSFTPFSVKPEMAYVCVNISEERISWRPL